MHLVNAADKLRPRARKGDPWKAAIYALLSVFTGFVIFLGSNHPQNQMLAWITHGASEALIGTIPDSLPPSMVLLGVVVVLLALGSLQSPWHLAQQLTMALVGAWVTHRAFSSPLMLSGTDFWTLNTLRAEVLLLGTALVYLNLRTHALSVPINFVLLLTVALTLAKDFSEVGGNNVLVREQWHLGLAFVVSTMALYAIKVAIKKYIELS